MEKDKDKLDKSLIRTIYEHEFRSGSTIAQTVRNVNTLFGDGSTNKVTVGRWFKKFRNGNFELTNDPRGKPEVKVDNKRLKIIVESNPSQTVRELAVVFNVSVSTISAHLTQIGKVKKSDQWVSRRVITTQEQDETIDK